LIQWLCVLAGTVPYQVGSDRAEVLIPSSRAAAVAALPVNASAAATAAANAVVTDPPTDFMRRVCIHCPHSPHTTLSMRNTLHTPHSPHTGGARSRSRACGVRRVRRRHAQPHSYQCRRGTGCMVGNKQCMPPLQRNGFVHLWAWSKQCAPCSAQLVSICREM
jgi:hypothetical protein